MNRTLWLVVGIISILGGIFALFNPLSATLAAEQIAGFLFLFVGILQFVALFTVRTAGAKLFAAIGGIIGVLLGFELLTQPMQGILTLTMVVAILFMITGVVRTLSAFALRGTGAFVPVLFSGIISIILAIMIFAGYPESSTYILGVLLAIELISNGLSLVMYSRVHPTLTRSL